MPFDNICPVDSEEKTKTVYILRQVFRGKYGGSIETSRDLGTYSSKKRVDRAAELFMHRELFHPDSPYVLYILPCEVDTDPRVLAESEGYYVSVDTCRRER